MAEWVEVAPTSNARVTAIIRTRRRWSRSGLLSAPLWLLAIALAGCASAPADDPLAKAAFEEANDPLEPFNRYIFEVNRFIDIMALRPLAEVYVGIVPEPGRDAVRNFLDNLKTPVILANDVLQGEMSRAATTSGRFLTNSTIGILGLFDVAAHFGLEKHDEDFGQTLAVYGVGEGIYLVLPLLGSAPPRDAVGTFVDGYFDPLNLWARNTDRDWIPITRYAVDAIDFRGRNLEAFDEIERTSIDLYATVRSLYRQRRADEIRNGDLAPLVPVPQISIDLDEDTGEAALTLTSP